MTADEVAQAQSIKNSLEIGRYVFLVFAIFQFIALLITIVMRIKNPYKEDPDTLEEQRAARSAMAQIQMESLKHSVSRGSKHPTSPAPDSSNYYTASNKMMRRLVYI